MVKALGRMKGNKWDGKGIWLYLAFVPWLSFWGLMVAKKPEIAAPVGACLALILFIIRVRERKVHTFEIFGLVSLLLTTFLVFYFSNSVRDRIPNLTAGGFFFLLMMSVYSFSEHKPFTLPYLLEDMDPKTDPDPLLKKKGFRSSLLWTLSF